MADKDNILEGLNEMVTGLLMESMNSRYSSAEQQRLNDQGREVRRRLIELRQMQFDRNTQGYQEASEGLELANAIIREALDRIDRLVELFSQIARLVASLDRIIQAATLIV